MNANDRQNETKPDLAVEAAARIVRGVPPKADNMNRRDAMRIAAIVAAYAVDRAAKKITGEA